jgi:hypothetical protein
MEKTQNCCRGEQNMDVNITKLTEDVGRISKKAFFVDVTIMF